MYGIATDRQAHRLDVTFSGALLQEDLAPFDRDLRAAALEAKAGGNYFDMLCDFSNAGVMPQDVAADGAARVDWCVANGLRKSANLTNSALMKMQLDRVAATDQVKSFTSRAEALAWLAEA